MSTRAPRPDNNPSPASGHGSLSLIDTHCHLYMKEFDADRDAVLQRAQGSGFEALITVGSDLEGSIKGMELAGRHGFIFSAIGIHPHDAGDFTEDTYAQLKAWSKNSKVVAIGETGLDYHYDHSPRDIQRAVFRRHLELGRETGLPVIVHSREAGPETLEILADSGVTNGVLHCFSGDQEMAEQAMAMGFYLSIAGPVTFRKAAQLKEIVRGIPDDYLLVETDAPYLTPEPWRGRRNEPSFMVNTVAEIARLRKVSLEDMARITTLNARRLFGIGVIPEKAEIAYQIRDSLYLNITNRCTNACSFCIRFRSDFVKGHNLRLGHEPSGDEVKAAIGDPSPYREIVFCGYGEPLQRLDIVKEVARWVKERGGRVRINTNGHANLIHRRNILPELAGLVDSISVSLDAHDDATYNMICKPVFRNAFSEVLLFIREAKKYIPDVQVTVVAMKEVDIEKSRQIAEGLGASFRVRKLDVVG